VLATSTPLSNWPQAIDAKPQGHPSRPENASSNSSTPSPNSATPSPPAEKPSSTPNPIGRANSQPPTPTTAREMLIIARNNAHLRPPSRPSSRVGVRPTTDPGRTGKGNS